MSHHHHVQRHQQPSFNDMVADMRARSGAPPRNPDAGRPDFSAAAQPDRIETRQDTAARGSHDGQRQSLSKYKHDVRNRGLDQPMASDGKPAGGADALRYAATPAGPHGIVHYHASGESFPLATTHEQAAAIAAGQHQRTVVDGKVLAFPSQDITMTRSARPDAKHQNHIFERHIGTTEADDRARLSSEGVRAAGSFTDVATAQYAIDHTVATDRNQNVLDNFVHNSKMAQTALRDEDLGRTVGHVLTREAFDGGGGEQDATGARVVVTKDKTFPEGYRVSTAYPVIDAVGGPKKYH